MSIIRDYIDYLKDNPEHYWFKRKLYGWGWDPATKEGWAVTLGSLALIAGNAFRLEALGLPDTELAIAALAQTLALVAVLLIICYKTGEKPKWQWGLPKKFKK